MSFFGNHSHDLDATQDVPRAAEVIELEQR